MKHKEQNHHGRLRGEVPGKRGHQGQALTANHQRYPSTTVTAELATSTLIETLQSGGSRIQTTFSPGHWKSAPAPAQPAASDPTLYAKMQECRATRDPWGSSCIACSTTPAGSGSDLHSPSPPGNDLCIFKSSLRWRGRGGGGGKLACAAFWFSLRAHWSREETDGSCCSPEAMEDPAGGARVRSIARFKQDLKGKHTRSRVG
eukprot:764057-Hanusia_phi.AAC.2